MPSHRVPQLPSLCSAALDGCEHEAPSGGGAGVAASVLVVGGRGPQRRAWVASLRDGGLRVSCREEVEEVSPLGRGGGPTALVLGPGERPLAESLRDLARRASGRPVVVAGVRDPEERIALLEQGAADVVGEVDPRELTLRVQRLAGRGTTKERGRGTGLGLATVYGIVKGAHGEIVVETEPDRGTTFQVWLPAAEATEEEAAEDPAGERDDARAGTILVVEDEDYLRRVACRVLRRDGHRVLAADSGVEGLEMWRREGRDVDLILSDVMMPSMGGREMVDAMRREEPDVRVLYMSGYTDDTIVRAGIDAGRVALLEKPFDAEGLREAVLQALVRPA